ncbi:TPA: hypothetical protein ACYEOO_004229, partial [Klebsiella michiganensis]
VASATARRASEESHPARPTNVKKRPKGAFLLSAISSKSTTIRNTLMLRYSTVVLRLPWLQLAQASSPDRCAASPPGNVPGLMPLRGFIRGRRLTRLARATDSCVLQVWQPGQMRSIASGKCALWEKFLTTFSAQSAILFSI